MTARVVLLAGSFRMPRRFFFLLLAFLFSAASLQAQSLRWSYSPSSATLPHDSNILNNYRTDSIGTAAVVLDYLNGGVTSGYQFLWFNRLGKVLQKTEFEVADGYNTPPLVLRVTSG